MKQASDGETWFAIRTVLSAYSVEVEKLLLLEEKEQMKQMLDNVTSGRGEERIFLDDLMVGNIRENKAGRNPLYVYTCVCVSFLLLRTIYPRIRRNDSFENRTDDGAVVTLKSKFRQLLPLTEWHIGDTVGISLGASELDGGQAVGFFDSIDEDILNLAAKGNLIRKTETSIVIRCRDRNNVLRNVLPSSSGRDTTFVKSRSRSRLDFL